jgi:hypothetical protein
MTSFLFSVIGILWRCQLKRTMSFSLFRYHGSLHGASNGSSRSISAVGDRIRKGAVRRKHTNWATLRITLNFRELLSAVECRVQTDGTSSCAVSTRPPRRSAAMPNSKCAICNERCNNLMCTAWAGPLLSAVDDRTTQQRTCQWGRLAQAANRMSRGTLIRQ